MGNANGEQRVTVDGQEIPVISTNTVVIGSGSAGYCAADRLHQLGQTDVTIVTDRVRAGTSRNAGSDKQTYYKLTLAGLDADSVGSMAQTLFGGGAMDGDTALIEAALSPQAFMHLVDLGVPFPRNRFGEFVGYKTDHDPRQRATSAGPYTSKSMVEGLEAHVRANGTRVLDDIRLIDIVVSHTDTGSEAVGVLGLRRGIRDEDAAHGVSRFILIRAKSVVLACGGPAGMYARSVFPQGQWGASGAAYRAGAWGHNLTEWQFGLSSIHPRWNVSGSYMQVIPTFMSTAADGSGPREFLTEAIPDYGHQLSLIFLKGYQWPFDIRKVDGGSSLIDLLVHREIRLRGRRVFVDFRHNPFDGRDLDATALNEETRNYLARAGALSGSPIERLRHMNEPAYRLYLEKNPSIDLERKPLEVDLCVQHNNGGLAVDAWWQSTTLLGLFPVGEAAGAHGVYRPGGAALNSTQVGATRAAQWITAHRTGNPVGLASFTAAAAPLVREATALVEATTNRCRTGTPDNTAETLDHLQTQMSDAASEVRSRASIAHALSDVQSWLSCYDQDLAATSSSRRSIERVFLIRDILITQDVYLSAMLNYLDHGGRSRGSVLYTDPEGDLPHFNTIATGIATEIPGLPEDFRYTLDGGALDDEIQEVGWKRTNPLVDHADPGDIQGAWRQRRPLPGTADDFFENIWRDYRETGGIL